MNAGEGSQNEIFEDIGNTMLSQLCCMFRSIAFPLTTEYYGHARVDAAKWPMPFLP